MTMKLLGGVAMALSVLACTPKIELPVTVSPEKMAQLYDEVKTPFKYGLVMVPDSNSHKMDCPTIFRHDDKWVMTYIVFDGRGYETHLAWSKDLIHWDEQGCILQFSDTTDWDANQKAGYPSLIEYDWGGAYGINAYDSNYWMSYFGGNSTGYEAGVLSFGMAYTEEDPATLHQWKRLPEPVMAPTDPDADWYDNITMYKNYVLEDNDQLTGHPFVMFYNAKGDSISKVRGAERISMAFSDDMKQWKRYSGNPVLNHHIGITGDAVIQKIGNVYVMFFFRAYWPEGKTVVYNSFAASYDLLHWTEWTGQKLIEPSESYDNQFAHKSFVIQVDGVVYHYYNAVDTLGNRGIALASSMDLGKSELTFNSTTVSEVK